jgi:hypothetical protein
MNLLTKSYKPCGNHVLIKFVPKEGSAIFLPDGKTAGQRIMVEGIGPDVERCNIGDEIVAAVGPEMIGVDEAAKLAIIPETYVVAIIE